jgi:hypothetical protein
VFRSDDRKVRNGVKTDDLGFLHVVVTHRDDDRARRVDDVRVGDHVGAIVEYHA